jgi:hypothetical protein
MGGLSVSAVSEIMAVIIVFYYFGLEIETFTYRGTVAEADTGYRKFIFHKIGACRENGIKLSRAHLETETGVEVIGGK